MYPIRVCTGGLLLLAGLTATTSAQQPAEIERNEPAAQPQRYGRLIQVPLPITGEVDSQVARQVNAVLADRSHRDEQPVLVFEFKAKGRDAGTGSDLGSALNLARFLTSPELGRARKVAFLPQTVKGHAVLAVMACDEIIMHPEAQLGEAGIDEKAFDPAIPDFYASIADRRRTIPKDIVLKMLSPDLELLQAQTDQGPEAVLRENLNPDRHREPVTLVAAGEPGLFTAAQAREWRFASLLAEDRSAVATALGLARESLAEDPSASDVVWRPIIVELKGPLSPKQTAWVQRRIDDAIRQDDVNLIFLWFESPGGAPADSAALATYLSGLDPAQRRTVAYVPTEARGDAAAIALACDEIVMHAGAALGGDEPFRSLSPDELSAMVVSVREIASRKSHSPALAAAIVDPKQSAARYTRQTDGAIDYFTLDDVDALPDKNDWQKGFDVTQLGQSLLLTGERAKELGLARELVADFDAVKASYGITVDPPLLAPGWVDYLVEILNSTTITGLLLVVGFIAAWIELNSPGIGAGAIIALLCCVLFFWSRILGGTAGWLEVSLFVFGIAALMIELFVLPGFGVFGLTGGVCVIASVVLASQTFYVPHSEAELREFRDTLLTLAGAGVGTVAVLYAFRRYLPNAPLFGQVMLEPPNDAELETIAANEVLARYDHLLGARGVALTQLAPAGKVRFGDERVDVVSDGRFIDRGAEVEVIETKANRVVVRPIS